MGFYFPQKGKITIDNEELTPKTLKAWQNMIAYVSQEVFIFDASFAQNIAMTLDNDKIDRDKINKVLETVKLQSLFALYPDGMDTKIGEITNRLSGGEKQRLGIARALYKDAEVIDKHIRLHKQTNTLIIYSYHPRARKSYESFYSEIMHEYGKFLDKYPDFQ